MRLLITILAAGLVLWGLLIWQEAAWEAAELPAGTIDIEGDE